MIAQSRPRRGYVLLLTLVILSLAGAVTARVCRESIASSVRSLGAEEALQRRWGVFSCQYALLPRLKQLLNEAELRQGIPVGIDRIHLNLNHESFDLVLADEQAKLDANMLVRLRGRGEAEATVKRLMLESGCGIRPRFLAGGPKKIAAGPSRATAAKKDSAKAGESAEEESQFVRPLQSFGQVFPLADPAQLFGPSRAAASAYVTCWGNGHLNFRRASSRVLKEFCPPTLSAAKTNHLIHIRETAPGTAPMDALKQMHLTEEEEDQMDNRFIDESSCFSLQIIVNSAERAWYHLAVLDQSADVPETLLFSW